MQTVPISDTERTEVPRPGGMGYRRNYIGKSGAIAMGPQGFLVERMYPNPVIDPHFHDVDQFQVVVAGDGSMGKQKVAPITFQYADAYTPYGPIVGNDNGISFFTLRPIASGGHWVMPGNRENMKGRAGRNIAGLFDYQKKLPDRGMIERDDLMEPQRDGVNAIGFRLGPNTDLKCPPSDAGGQFILTCCGEFDLDDKVMDSNSLIHLEPEEDPPILRSGNDGASVLIMQFGRPSNRPGSDPVKMAKRDPNGYVDKQVKAGQLAN